MQNRKIDLVYTWVDGDDIEWQKKKNKCLNNSEEFIANQKSRFKDNEELRFSLRSVEKYASWINHIYIITDNQAPRWLDLDHPKITIVDHKDIMPEDSLPNFNSCSIEHCIANIPNLSEYFLYANDDTFFGDYVTPDFFFTKDDKPILRVKKPSEGINKRQHITTILNSFNIVKSHGYKIEFYNNHHNIDAYKKSVVKQCYEEFKNEIDKTIHNQFRSSEDYQRIIYTYYADATRQGVLKILNKKIPFYKKIFSSFINNSVNDSMFFNNKSKNIFEKITKLKPKLFCINDALNSDFKDKNLSKETLIELFDQKSSFEKYDIDDSGKNCEQKYDCMIFAPWSSLEFGSVLSCYGIQCLMAKLGKNTKIINFVSNVNRLKCDNFAKSYVGQFTKRYLNLTSEMFYYDNLYRLNDYCDTFLTVFNTVVDNNIEPDFYNNYLNYTVQLLDFIRSNKRKIAFASNFTTTGKPVRVKFEKMNFYLSQFSDISLKEKNKMVFLKEKFGIDADMHIDCAFHIPQSYLKSAVQNYQTEEKYIGILNWADSKKYQDKNKILETISGRLNLPIKESKFDYKTPIEEFLAFINNSQFMIADSYYSALFSIIFNKPFIQTDEQSSTETLFEILNIQNKTVPNDGTEPDYDELLKPVDWEFVNNKIEEERNKAEIWMKNALEKEVKASPMLPNFLEDTTYKLMSDANKIFTRYLICKILFKITFGNTKKLFKRKKKFYKVWVKKIRCLKGSENA